MVAEMKQLVVAALSGLALVACGGAPAASPEHAGTVATTDEPDCAALRAAADEASAALERCRAGTPEPAWAQREAFDWLDGSIGARLDALRRGERRASTAVEMQEISEHVWALLDELPEEQRDPQVLARIEDASEQLMHPHDAEGRERALAELAGALGVLRERLEPAPREGACEGEGRASAEAWMRAEAACGAENGGDR